jgi:hypothetical protein
MAAYAASKTVDRDGWIRVQKKTFTRWANNHLKTRGMEIADLCEDVRSGVLLLNLLEIIGGESIKQVLNAKVCLASQNGLFFWSPVFVIAACLPSDLSRHHHHPPPPPRPYPPPPPPPAAAAASSFSPM